MLWGLQALQFVQENPIHKLKFMLNLLVENCLFLILNESRKNLPRDMLVAKLQQLLQIVLTKNLGHNRNSRSVVDRPEEISKLAKVKAQVLEVKEFLICT
ncbi:hypothetical protein AgCh_013431 [Apium graveolens]